MNRYKLEWEMVKSSELWKYCNEDPRWYSNTKQIVPNSRIPDSDWKSISNESENDTIFEQYKNLKYWEDNDMEFVRNVKLYKSSEPQWEETTVEIEQPH